MGPAKDVSVYLDPANPSQAMIDNIPDRVVAGGWLLIAGPVVAALVLLVVGGTRNYRWFRQKIRLVREYRGEPVRWRLTPAPGRRAATAQSAADPAP